MLGTQQVLPEAGHRARQQEEATARKVSLDATRLLAHVKAHREGACTLEELARDLRISRAACARALRELEEAGAVSLHVEEKAT